MEAIKIPDGYGNFIAVPRTPAIDYLQALADKRLVLLKRTEKKMVFCLECDGRLTNFGKAEELKGMGYEVGHTGECKLEEAIDGDQD